jgi:hypothetical protein
VKSETHSAFGRSARNCRLTRSSGHGVALSLTVVLTGLPRITPLQAHAAASAAPPCSAATSRPRAAAAARPCARRRPGSSRPRPADLLAQRRPARRAASGRPSADRIGRGEPHAGSTSTGRSATPCRSARPRRHRGALVDERRHGLNRRSSSAWAKYATPCAGSRWPGAARGSSRSSALIRSRSIDDDDARQLGRGGGARIGAERAHQISTDRAVAVGRWHGFPRRLDAVVIVADLLRLGVFRYQGFDDHPAGETRYRKNPHTIDEVAEADLAVYKARLELDGLSPDFRFIGPGVGPPDGET